MNFRVELLKKSIELGFSNYGIAQACFLQEYYDFLQKAIDAKVFCDMHYLSQNPENRCNPQSLLEDARSVLVFLYPYPANIIQKSQFKIAQFALSEDYHWHIKAKLKILADFILNFYPESHYKIGVDTLPVLEKRWAVKAGLGWIGKNKLLTTEQGSFFNIGIILSSEQFEYDQPVANLCGDCTRCITHCLNQALWQFLNCKKCIAYQTIEAKDKSDFKNLKSENYIFECDICQIVCPYNQSQKENLEQNRLCQNWINLNDEDLENLSIQDFNRLKKNTALSRMKHADFINLILNSYTNN